MIEITRNLVYRNLVYLAKYLFTWLDNAPDSWTEVVRFMVAYTLMIGCTIVIYKMPSRGQYKCSSDETSTSNYGPSSIAFCIRNNVGNMVYTEGKRT